MIDGHRFGPELLMNVVLAALLAGSLAFAADDQKSDSNTGSQAVPADLANWKIRFDGFAGTPGDRSWFRVSLAHDGTIKVEKRRIGRGGYRTVLDEKLEQKETDEFFRTAAKIINEYRRDKSTGKQQDGWKLTLGVSSNSFKEKSVTFYDQDDPGERDAPPGFDVLAKIINRHLTNEHFPE